jgi:protein-tyrosine phosphatase
MASFGIKVVCDFRTDGEVELRGEDQLPTGVEYLQLPVADPNNDLGAKIETAIISEDRAAQERLLGNGKSEKILLDAAPFLVSSRPARDAYRALLDRLTDRDTLPTLTHCTAGKDRTGWSTAVILTALGVPKDTVIEDYLLTNELTAEQIESRIESAAALMDDSELIRPLLEARTEYLEASFTEMRQKYGTFANYLRKGLGVSKADLEALKQNLLTD